MAYGARLESGLGVQPSRVQIPHPPPLITEPQNSLRLDCFYTPPTPLSLQPPPRRHPGTQRTQPLRNSASIFWTATRPSLKSGKVQPWGAC